MIALKTGKTALAPLATTQGKPHKEQTTSSNTQANRTRPLRGLQIPRGASNTTAYRARYFLDIDRFINEATSFLPTACADLYTVTTTVLLVIRNS
jgi:hypothetical protein